jgi:tryptophanyl-tRNA synthetase
MLGDVMVPELLPVRERTLELRAEPKRVLEILRDGGSKARTVAESTMKDVRAAMGLTTAE